MSLPTHAICIGTYELLLPRSLVHEKHAKSCAAVTAFEARSLSLKPASTRLQTQIPDTGTAQKAVEHVTPCRGPFITDFWLRLCRVVERRSCPAMNGVLKGVLPTRPS